MRIIRGDKFVSYFHEYWIPMGNNVQHYFKTGLKTSFDTAVKLVRLSVTP